MQVAEYLSHLQRDADLLVKASERAGLSAPVPSCSQWDVLRLLSHLTRVHHWSAAIVSGLDRETFRFDPPTAESVHAVFAEGVVALSTALRSLPASRSVWTMFPDLPPALFWARRQAHETAIHRVDGELAAGLGVTEIDSAFAVDGIDELLMGMLPATLRVALDRPFTLTVAPLDANAGWTLQADSGGLRGSLGSVDNADLTIFGMAADLYRWLWNRAGDDEISLRGDLTLVDVWHERFRIGAR
jgi:uncharacterized protein (TIGR03083 family)